MKKSLLALAVLGAFAGAASAQSSVTVYGVVDTGIASVDTGADRTTSMESGMDGASRIGFKGVEDLGNGLKAEFTLENGINTDDGSGKADPFSRLAFVGLKGAFGTVRLGKQNTQVKDMLGQIDPFKASGMVNGVDFINGGNLNQRVGNQITWTSNSYSGFQASVGYVFGEVAGDNSANRNYGARLGYKNGPLNVQFGYSNENITADANADGSYTDPLTAADSVNAVDANVKDMLIGATYDFGSFKLHGIYGERKADAGFDSTGAGDVKIRSGLIGVTVPFGASAIRAEYIRNSNKDIDNADSNVFAVSYSYAMSKRTHLYATYLHSNNDANSTLGFGGPGTVDAGENGSALGVGIQHKF